MGDAPGAIFGALIPGLGLSDAGVTYLEETANSDPSRKVGRKRRRNMILDVPMRSVPGTLQAESLTGEFMFLTELDSRDDVIAAYDQPLTVNLRITDKLGRATRTTYTADYLVVHKDRVCVYEIKSDEELEQLLGIRQKDWTAAEGGYQYLPAKKHFAELGITHVVVPISSLSQIRSANLRLLAGIRNLPESSVLRKCRAKILQIVKSEPAILLKRVLELIGIEDTTAALQLIASEQIFADLDRVTLTDPSSVWLALDPSRARIAQSSSMHLRSILMNHDGQVESLIGAKYEADIATRLAIIDGLTRVGRKGAPVSERSIRRYRAAHRDGGAAAMEPKWARCGPREPRISFTHQTYMNELIRQGGSSPERPSISAMYRAYKSGFAEPDAELEFLSEGPVCRSSFYNYAARYGFSYEDALQKGGRRLANVESDVFDPAKRATVATRPFEVAHLDHWKVDLHVWVAKVKDKVISRRPWLTCMIDAFTGEILALWLSFAAPSKKSCSMVVRDCVRRHGRLPEIVIVDCGSDFRSVHFFVMLASLGVVRCERPPEDPRFGQQVERIFLEFKERFARGLPGFGISIELARSISSSLRSGARAKLNLLEAFEALEAFCFRRYNQIPRPDSFFSPTDRRAEAMRKYPHCGIRTEWDLKFLIQTSIEAPVRSYTLWPGQGVHVNDRWYSSPRLLRYQGHKKDVSLRLEPFSDSVIYVWIDGKWVVCAHSSASFSFAHSDSVLVHRSSQTRDLAALIQELRNEMDHASAEIVNAKLHEIAARRSSAASAASAASPEAATSGSEASAVELTTDFDDIEPYDSEEPA